MINHQIWRFSRVQTNLNLGAPSFFAFPIKYKHLNLGAVPKSQLSQLPPPQCRNHPEPLPAAQTTSAGAAVCRSPHRFHGGRIFVGIWKLEILLWGFMGYMI